MKRNGFPEEKKNSLIKVAKYYKLFFCPKQMFQKQRTKKQETDLLVKGF